MIMQTARVLFRLAIRQRSPPSFSMLAWKIFLVVRLFFKSCIEIKGSGTLGDVLSPGGLLGESLEHVERLVVILAVVLVERRSSVFGQRVR